MQTPKQAPNAYTHTPARVHMVGGVQKRIKSFQRGDNADSIVEEVFSSPETSPTGAAGGANGVSGPPRQQGGLPSAHTETTATHAKQVGALTPPVDSSTPAPPELTVGPSRRTKPGPKFSSASLDGLVHEEATKLPEMATVTISPTRRRASLRRDAPQPPPTPPPVAPPVHPPLPKSQSRAVPRATSPLKKTETARRTQHGSTMPMTKQQMSRLMSPLRKAESARPRTLSEGTAVPAPPTRLVVSPRKPLFSVAAPHTPPASPMRPNVDTPKSTSFVMRVVQLAMFILWLLMLGPLIMCSWMGLGRVLGEFLFGAALVANAHFSVYCIAWG